MLLPFRGLDGIRTRISDRCSLATICISGDYTIIPLSQLRSLPPSPMPVIGLCLCANNLSSGQGCNLYYADCIPNTKKRDNPVDGHPLPIFQTYPRPRPRLGPAPTNWLPSQAEDGAGHRPLPKERSPDSELLRPPRLSGVSD